MDAAPRIILCVDDDADDRELVCYTINEIDATIEVVQAENGLEALTYLQEANATRSLPCLVILDINMPKMDGKETLTEMKKDERLQKLPVVIFSTSKTQMDKVFCAHHGVELVTKPDSLQSIRSGVERLLLHCAEV